MGDRKFYLFFDYYKFLYVSVFLGFFVNVDSKESRGVVKDGVKVIY